MSPRRGRAAASYPSDVKNLAALYRSAAMRAVRFVISAGPALSLRIAQSRPHGIAFPESRAPLGEIARGNEADSERIRERRVDVTGRRKGDRRYVGRSISL